MWVYRSMQMVSVLLTHDNGSMSESACYKGNEAAAQYDLVVAAAMSKRGSKACVGTTPGSYTTRKQNIVRSDEVKRMRYI